MGRGALCVALIAAAFSLGSAPQKISKPERQQQTDPTKHPAAQEQQGAPGRSKDSGCPGTPTPQFSCDAVTAEATVQQVGLMRGNNWLSIITAAVAGAAAAFAWGAARAASKSYKAFVAAEDAFLFIEMPDGAVIQSAVAGGEILESYFLSVKLTNLGRSPARIHRYEVGEEDISVSKTLKQDDSMMDGWRIHAENLEPFPLRIIYSTALRPSATLIVMVRAKKSAGKLIGEVLGTTLWPRL